MDDQLNQIYGTVPEAEDTEKLAAAELAANLSNDGELNLEELTAEDAEALATELIGQQEEIVEDTTTAETTAEEVDPDLKEKISQADYAGRVMAHAMVHELKLINQEQEKTAQYQGSKWKEPPAHLREGTAAAEMPKGLKRGVQAAKNMGQLGAHLAKTNPKKAIGAGAAVLGGAALLAAKKHNKSKEKKSSAETTSPTPNFDRLVVGRAEEYLRANGIDPATGNKAEETETTKQSAAQDPKAVLEAAVDASAQEYLKSLGYTFEETAAATE